MSFYELAVEIVVVVLAGFVFALDATTGRGQR